MMDEKRNIMNQLDCLSITTLLSLSWDERLARKLLAQYGIRHVNTGDDGALTLYQLHRECHDPDSAVPSILVRHFSQRYTREIECLKSISFEIDDNKMLETTVEGIGENPGAMFWAMALDERPQMQSLLAYHAHRLLLYAFHGEDGAVFREEKTRMENKQLREQLRMVQNTVSELEMTRIKLESENTALKREKEETAAMKRELRMLRYQIAHGQAGPAGTLPDKLPKGKTVTLEVDSPEPVHRKVCEEKQAQGKCTLENLKVALIGGLSRLEDQYRSAFETLGAAKFYFHTGCCDGGGSDRLRQATRAADIVVFITRVNSHNALQVIKGVCRKSGKSFLAVRETSPEMISRILLERLQSRIIAEPSERNARVVNRCVFCPNSAQPEFTEKTASNAVEAQER